MEGFSSIEPKERSFSGAQKSSAFRAGSGAFSRIVSLCGSARCDIGFIERAFS